MSLIPALIIALAAQNAAPKPIPMRKVEVKPAGLSLEIPKAWKLNPKEANTAISARVPIEGSKVVGRLEAGYVLIDGTDSDAYSRAQTELLTGSGFKVDRQWTVDVMGKPFVFTKSSKDNETIVRGVFFREIESKLFVKLSAPSDVFEKVEPVLANVLSTLKDIKVVAAKKDVVPQEKQIPITPNYPGKLTKLPVKHPVLVNGTNLFLLMPRGGVPERLSDTSVSVTVPGLALPVFVDVLTVKDSDIAKVFFTKPAETLKLFKGSVQRIDRLDKPRVDMQQRRWIIRKGASAKTGKDMMMIDGMVAGAAEEYLYLSFQSNDPARFAAEEKTLINFANSIKLELKK